MILPPLDVGVLQNPHRSRAHRRLVPQATARAGTMTVKLLSAQESVRLPGRLLTLNPKP